MSEAPVLRLGTRGSALALAQAEQVAEALGGAELVTITTSGDKGRGGDKARFVREIEAALLAGEVELAVHSAKDLPTELPGGLEIAGVPEREDPRDVYVGEGGSLAGLPEGARLGTSSLRRRSQLLAARPDLEVVGMRGNVDTRLRKLAEGELDGIVLAAAGLRRLGREGEIAFEFGGAELTPAAGQGAIALEARDDDPAVARAQMLTDRAALARVSCERAVVARLGAGCDTPVGAHAWIEADRMRVRGFCGLPDGSDWIRDETEGDASDPDAIGEALAERMLAAGAAEVLERSATMASEASP